MWNIMWKKHVKIVQFSHSFHTFFTHFSHEFHTHISHACEILLSEIYVKWVWNDVNPFTHIFTYSSHGVSHRLSNVTPHWMAKEFHMVLTCKFTHIFTYTSNGVSHVLSHAFVCCCMISKINNRKTLWNSVLKKRKSTTHLFV